MLIKSRARSIALASAVKIDESSVMRQSACLIIILTQCFNVFSAIFIGPLAKLNGFYTSIELMRMYI